MPSFGKSTIPAICQPPDFFLFEASKAHPHICELPKQICFILCDFALPVTLGILNVVILTHSHAAIDNISSGVDHGFLECAKSRRQVMDIAFPAVLLIEKGMDILSNMCVALAEVRQYYDHLGPSLLKGWMLKHSVPPGLSLAALSPGASSRWY